MTDSNVEAPRYPRSADLFRFCKAALAIRHNNEVKVIDQHVGAILGFDPADCSHWKRGKKNIRSLQTVHTIAKHLDVDPRIVSNLIAGRADVAESLQEFRGYGPLEVSSKYYEELKKDYFKDPARFARNGRSRSFDEIATIDLRAIESKAEELLVQAQIDSCPVMIPELVAILPQVNMVSIAEDEGEPVRLESNANGEFTISVFGGPSKPYLRFLTAQALGRVILEPETATQESNEVAQARATHFAIALLMPRRLVALAMREIDETQDVVGQISSAFWMTRSLVHLRLKSMLSKVV